MRQSFLQKGLKTISCSKCKIEFNRTCFRLKGKPFKFQCPVCRTLYQAENYINDIKISECEHISSKVGRLKYFLYRIGFIPIITYWEPKESTWTSINLTHFNHQDNPEKECNCPIENICPECHLASQYYPSRKVLEGAICKHNPYIKYAYSKSTNREND